MSQPDAYTPATVDFADSATIDSATIDLADNQAGSEFVRGATWSLKRLAAWLEQTNIVADDERSQHAVNATKRLIAQQAVLAADHLPIARQVRQSQ